MLEVSRAMGRDEEPLAYHVIIIADGRARLLHSASLFREGQSSEHRHYLGWASRYLHAQNMLYYRRQGYAQYDWGGWYSGTENESLLRVNRFKEEFGGKVVCEYDAMVGCSLSGSLALRAQDWFHQLKSLAVRKAGH
jgi:lipid II:glycine glycyltransferase (peptidoglycan interpeptide bridge formation enzyme)